LCLQANIDAAGAGRRPLAGTRCLAYPPPSRAPGRCSINGRWASTTSASPAIGARSRLGPGKPAFDADRDLRRSAEHFVDRRTDVEPPRTIDWWVGTSYDSTALVEAPPQ